MASWLDKAASVVVSPISFVWNVISGTPSTFQMSDVINDPANAMKLPDNAVIPGTGSTVAELHNLEWSDDEILAMLPTGANLRDYVNANFPVRNPIQGVVDAVKYGNLAGVPTGDAGSTDWEFYGVVVLVVLLAAWGLSGNRGRR